MAGSGNLRDSERHAAEIKVVHCFHCIVRILHLLVFDEAEAAVTPRTRRICGKTHPVNYAEYTKHTVRGGEKQM